MKTSRRDKNKQKDKNKRKDKNKTLKSVEVNIPKSPTSLVSGGIGKRILILTEGETEKDYFTGIKNNSHLKNQLAGVQIEKSDSLVTMLWTAMKNRNEYNQIWLVCDNDKRNAFILNGAHLPLRELEEHFDEDKHRYFFSIHDYLQWLESSLGANKTIEEWDSIQHKTTKNSDFEKYESRNPYKLFMESELFKNKEDKKYATINSSKSRQFDPEWKDFTQLAYACIAFEYWLILHFEKNKMPFLWVDKGKDETIDVFTYFRNYWNTDYAKGDNENQCTAYTCLLDNYKKNILTHDDEYQVIFRIIRAYLNTKWLESEMEPILKRQNYKWYEVNPYVKGLDELTAELLNIKSPSEEIKYFLWLLTFQFQYPNLNLNIVSNDYIYKEELIKDNINHKKCFEIRNTNNKRFLPIKIPTTQIAGGEAKTISMSYDIPQKERTNLVLFFNDPRQKSKSPLLIIPLTITFSDETKST